MTQPDSEIFITLFIFSLSAMNLQIFRFYRIRTREVDFNMIIHSPKPLFLKNYNGSHLRLYSKSLLTLILIECDIEILLLLIRKKGFFLINGMI